MTQAELMQHAQQTAAHLMAELRAGNLRAVGLDQIIEALRVSDARAEMTNVQVEEWLTLTCRYLVQLAITNPLLPDTNTPKSSKE